LLSPDEYAQRAHAIEEQIGRVIVGQRELVRHVLVCLLSEGHALLEGVPGLGKTMLLKTLAQALTLHFGRIQFTPDLMPADIVGTQVLEEDASGRRRFHFRAGPVFANLVLADEVNRATPKTQSALLEAMQERAVTVAGETRPLPRPFFVMATQNPIEMEGTYPLPEAQLDRFLLKALVPFPSADDLVAVVERTTGDVSPTVESVADGPVLAAMIDLTRQVPVASHVVQHAVDLVVASHPEEPKAPEMVRRYVRFGASPRAAQSLVLAAKASALLDSRPNVSIEDVRAMAHPALRHRLVLGYEAVADGVSPDHVVAAVLTGVPEPTAGLRGAP
jgi:MoxR-like ATPase